MKKAFLLINLITLSLFTFSCSNDDDGGGQDQLIGKWKLIKSTQTKNGVTTDVKLSDCTKKSYREFLADGNYSSIPYALDHNNNCIVDGESKGKWKNLKGTKYAFTLEGETKAREGNITFKEDTIIDKSERDDNGVKVIYTYIFKKQK